MATRFGAGLLAGWLVVFPAAAGTLATSPPPAAESIAPLQSVLLLPLDGGIDVDATGAVTHVRIDTPIPDDMRAGIEGVVRQWKFEPVTAGGVPVPASSKVRIVVGSPPVQLVTRVWVDSVTFTMGDIHQVVDRPGATIAVAKVAMPEYPTGVGLAGVKGQVQVGMRVGVDGRVVDAAVVRSSLLDVNGRKAVLEDALKQFEIASLRAARRFRFDVVVREGATPTADDLTVIVPYVFILGPASLPKAGEWRLHVRSPRRELAWLSTDAKARLAVLADAGDGATPITGGLRLLTPVGEDAAH